MRWLTPAGVLAAILVAGLLQAFSATAVPDLSPLTPQQLIAKVQQTKVETFSERTPARRQPRHPQPQLAAGRGEGGAGFNPTDLLSGHPSG